MKEFIVPVDESTLEQNELEWLKEQGAKELVLCKDCKFRGNINLCPLAYIEKAEQFTALCTDEWFCGNGKRKEGGELNGQGKGNELA